MRNSHRIFLTAIAAATLAFYSIPLFTAGVTIHWDALTYFYPYQKHVSDSLRAGRLPFWTSAVFSGFPFLADLQAGAWYPLNWPFFLAGIRPGSLFGELWLHALVAAAGTYLLAHFLVCNRWAAALAALMYGFGGYFAAHSEHVGLFQAAAYLPLMLWSFLRAVAAPSRARLAGCCVVGGCLCLTGHFQVILYVLSAVWLAACARASEQPERWRRIGATAMLISVASPLLAAVQVFPSLQLLSQSLRTQLEAKDRMEGMVTTNTLATLVYPKAGGTFDPEYRSSIDISESYFYAGALLVPLALIGLADRRARRIALFLIVPALAYSLGPITGVFWLIVRLPGFSSIRAPSHAMCLVTLGLVLLAAAGADVLSRRRAWIVPLLCALAFADLYFWNMFRTPLVYARGSYASNYAPVEKWFLELAKAPLPPLARVGAPGRWVFFYPAMAPFAWRVETTFGENPLLLKRYYEYELAAIANPRLQNTLGVVRYFGDPGWTVYENPDALPRFQFPSHILSPSDAANAARMLEELDPANAAVSEPGAQGLPAENGPGRVELLAAAEDHYELRTACPAECVLRIAIPYFPGWRAEVDGRNVLVFPLDRALMGVLLPTGLHGLRFYYHSDYFTVGAACSAALGMALLYLLLRPTGDRAAG